MRQHRVREEVSATTDQIHVHVHDVYVHVHVKCMYMYYVCLYSYEINHKYVRNVESLSSIIMQFPGLNWSQLDIHIWYDTYNVMYTVYPSYYNI